MVYTTFYQHNLHFYKDLSPFFLKEWVSKGNNLQRAAASLCWITWPHHLMHINTAGEPRWRWDSGSLPLGCTLFIQCHIRRGTNSLSCLLCWWPSKLLPRSNCTPERMSSCHKEPNPINQVGAENRRRKCAHVSPPLSLNNGRREEQAADRTLTHIWPRPDRTSRWPLKRLGGTCASCSTSLPGGGQSSRTG